MTCRRYDEGNRELEGGKESLEFVQKAHDQMCDVMIVLFRALACHSNSFITIFRTKHLLLDDVHLLCKLKKMKCSNSSKEEFLTSVNKCDETFVKSSGVKNISQGEVISCLSLANSGKLNSQPLLEFELGSVSLVFHNNNHHTTSVRRQAYAPTGVRERDSRQNNIWQRDS